MFTFQFHHDLDDDLMMMFDKLGSSSAHLQLKLEQELLWSLHHK